MRIGSAINIPDKENIMNDLAQANKIVLANTFKYYLKAHYYHWNVEGPYFVELHDLFGNIYEDAFGAVDTLAEELRKMDEYAPGSFIRFQQLSTIEDEVELIGWEEMINRLLDDTDKVLKSIEICYELAELAHNHGLSNFLAERQSAHKKFAWQMRSMIKSKITRFPNLSMHIQN
jgi:starvation-inducible DNA-binding protein